MRSSRGTGGRSDAGAEVWECVGAAMLGGRKGRVPGPAVGGTGAGAGAWETASAVL